LKEALRELERRISELEGAPLVGSQMTVKDLTGTVRGRFGRLADGVSYGLELSDGNGDPRFYVDETGFGLPRATYAVRDPAAVKTVTAGTFTQTWQVVMPQSIGPGIEVWIGWSTAAGTTGELRVNNNTVQTDPLALAAASSANAYVRWLHQIPLGTGPANLVVEARRTGGAGGVNVFQAMAWLREPADCTTVGVWV
jgi:hypothetical protein